jgi:TRAP-type mannitol/chloroaromatic compound transport system permease small subunit
MKMWSLYEKGVDLIANIMGKIGWFLILYCMIFGVTDVFLRYVLNAPSLWISTTVQAAMVLMACVGGVYALNENAFVKLDLFYANFSPRKKAVCDIITSIFTFLFLSVLIWKGISAAQMSIMLKQETPTGIPIPIYPIKTFIPISATCVLLVVIKKLGNDIMTIIGKRRD